MGLYETDAQTHTHTTTNPPTHRHTPSSITMAATSAVLEGSQAKSKEDTIRHHTKDHKLNLKKIQ